MRLHVPPRDFAIRVILRAITRAGWMVAGVLLVVTGVIVLDVLVDRGLGNAVAAPLGFLAIQLVALALMFLHPRRRTAVLYIVVSVISIAGYQLSLLTIDPSIGDSTPSILSRPIMALCAIGAITLRPIGGIQWTTGALLAGELTSFVVQFSLGRTVELGAGPLFAWVLVITLMLWALRSSANQSATVPDQQRIDEETRRMEGERDAETRAAAVVHDTVLSDLAAIVHGRVVLAADDRQHLRENIRRLSSAMESNAEPTASGRVDVDLLQVVRDLQWRGLSVELSGAGSALSLLDSPARTAALGAINAALENVLMHAGISSVDLFIDDTPDEVMIMVADQGQGFEVDAVGDDRLGLRLSVVGRMEDCGGRVTVWSRPGVGTSVMLSLPKPAGGPRGI